MKRMPWLLAASSTRQERCLTTGFQLPPGGADADIVVTWLPRGCGDTDGSMAAAAGGDPVVPFLHDSDDGWQTLTPRQGIVEPGPGGGIPADWPPNPNN